MAVLDSNNSNKTLTEDVYLLARTGIQILIRTERGEAMFYSSNFSNIVALTILT